MLGCISAVFLPPIPALSPGIALKQAFWARLEGCSEACIHNMQERGLGEKKKRKKPTTPLDRAVTVFRFGIRIESRSHAMPYPRVASPLFAESRVHVTSLPVCYRTHDL